MTLGSLAKHGAGAFRLGIALVVVVGVVAVHLRGVLLGERTFCSFDDQVFLLHPVLSYIGSSYSAGSIPLWCPNLMGGFSLNDYAQFSVFQPFLIAGYLFGIDGGTNPLSYDIAIAIHFCIFAFGIYYLCRCSKASFLVSLLISIASVIVGPLEGGAAWVNILAATAFAPYVFGGVVAIMNGNRGKVHRVAIACGVALCVLSNPSQPTILLLLSASVLVCLYIVKDYVAIKDGRMWLVIVSVGTGALFSSPYFRGVYLSMSESYRWTGHGAPITAKSAVAFQDFFSSSLHFDQLSGIILRDTKGPEVCHPYLGGAIIASVGLIVYSLCTSSYDRRREISLVILFSMLMLLISMGPDLGLKGILYRIPGLNRIRQADRILPFFYLGFVVVIGLSISSIRHARTTSLSSLALIFGPYLIFSLSSVSGGGVEYCSDTC